MEALTPLSVTLSRERLSTVVLSNTVTCTSQQCDWQNHQCPCDPIAGLDPGSYCQLEYQGGGVESRVKSPKELSICFSRL